MRISQEAEEVLEKMWICTQEEENDSVSLDSLGLDTASPEIEELIEIDNITLTGSHINLKEKGLENGRNVVRRHRLAERMLVDVLNTKDKYVHASACEFEHVLHRGVDESICTLLGHPRTCPHGKPIPEGECCRKAKEKLENVVAALSMMEKGQNGRVAYFEMGNEEKLQKMMAMGVLPGMPITLVQTYPSYVFDLDQTRYAIDREMASCIYVRLEKGE
jgi:DtxR family Mn-dependent transcriptional regulator